MSRTLYTPEHRTGVLVKTLSRLEPFRTGIHHTFHRYEHCFLELSRPQTKTEGTTKLLLENQIDILAINETYLKDVRDRSAIIVWRQNLAYVQSY